VRHCPQSPQSVEGEAGHMFRWLVRAHCRVHRQVYLGWIAFSLAAAAWGPCICFCCSMLPPASATSFCGDRRGQQGKHLGTHLGSAADGRYLYTCCFMQALIRAVEQLQTVLTSLLLHADTDILRCCLRYFSRWKESLRKSRYLFLLLCRRWAQRLL
jgi:hypothetical protein